MAFRIETERLLVRPWKAADRSVFERFAGDAEMMRYISRGQGWDAARVDAWLARQARNLAQHGCCVGAEIDPPNRASIRVAEKLGMRYQGIRSAHELAERNPEIDVLLYVLEPAPVPAAYIIRTG